MLSVVELHFMSFHERVSLSHETSEAATSNLIFRALSFRPTALMDSLTRSSNDMMSIKSVHTKRRSHAIDYELDTERQSLPW